MNEPFEPSATQRFEREFKHRDPIWQRIRAEVTLPRAIGTVIGLLAAGISLLIAALVQFNGLRKDVTNIQTIVAQPVVHPTQGEDIAVLKAKVDGLEKLEGERRALVEKTYQEMLSDPRFSRKRK